MEFEFFRYRNGNRGHMKRVIEDLIKKYLEVEVQFQEGHYDNCVAKLREFYKDDMSMVTGVIFARSQVAKRNLLVNLLVVSLVYL